jgi:nitrogen-specific signal transduction histidine kinase/ActR/RegA family two-component response regulator
MAPNDSITKDLPLELLYNFANAASSVLDIQSMMTHFFNLLSTEVDFDIGAFLVCHKNQTEGRLYARGGVERSVIEKFTRYFTGMVVKETPGLKPVEIPELDVSTLPLKSSGASGAAAGSEVRTLKVPLCCWGEVLGVIALASYGPERDFGDPKVVRMMGEHAGRVLERLFTHISDEERKLARILSSMTEGVYIVSNEGHFTAINPTGFDLVSRFCKKNSECLKEDRCPDSAGGTDIHCAFRDFIRKLPKLGDDTDPSRHTEEIKTEDIKNDLGMILAVSACKLSDGKTWRPGHLVTAKDVTDERLLQERIFLSSKLASLGEMAAGIAHEINNPLQAILLNIEMLGFHIAEKDKKRLECVEDGVTRIKNIVKDLLIFAREETTDTENVDINLVIEKAVDILRHQMKMANIEVALDLDKRPLIVECNRNLFQQVMINLLQNSKDAIEGASTGSVVTIRSTHKSPTEITVEVSDDGPGIQDKIKGRIFDPFLTTKDVGKGTGLGLSVSRKIIEGIGGEITAVSVPGGLTTFMIKLPHRGTVINERRSQRCREPDYSLLSGKSVLVIDDELEVLKTVTEAISRYVSRVEPIVESKEALTKIKERDFDLVFLDIKMPGIDGMELFKKIVEQKPDLADRIIFLSGDTESEKTWEFISKTGCRSLSKPLGIKDLLAAMCDIVSKKGLCAKH